MKDNLLFVSIIIPCRNEEKFIARCLDSIIAQDYPKDKLEVLVIDGMSEDRTREILEKYQRDNSFIKVLDNPERFTPYAMNIGIKNARGKIIMKADAHSIYQKDYISRCLLKLHRYKADNVGGVLKVLPSKNTLISKAIALVLSSKFGSADSFKSGVKKPRWSDAVAFGCFKKEVLKRIGPYDARMIRSQDLEFNLRLRKSGGKILLAPDIIAYYYAQPNLKIFLKHNFTDGLWVTYPLKFGKVVFSLRHLAPFLFVISLMGPIVLAIFYPFFWWLFIFILGLYILATLCFSLEISYKEKDLRYLFIMPIVFGARHISYGLGSLFGLIKLLF